MERLLEIYLKFSCHTIEGIIRSLSFLLLICLPPIFTAPGVSLFNFFLKSLKEAINVLAQPFPCFPFPGFGGSST
jgi:hypothetical protein